MNKFIAVVKREYKKVVFTWAFLITTFLMPLLASLTMIVPVLIFTIEGEKTRIAIVDPTGNFSKRLKDNLSPGKSNEKTADTAAPDTFNGLNNPQSDNFKRSADQIRGNFEIIDFPPGENSLEVIKRELTARIVSQEIDAYLLVPDNIGSRNARFELFSRKAGDFIINAALEDAVNDTVRSQRLADADISEEKLRELTGKIEFVKTAISPTGEVKDKLTTPWAGFIVAMLIYIVLLIYGQAIMGAIVEEKETKISEILFSSARPFELLMGKLVGVGLAGLTQLGIWIATLAAFLTFGIASTAASGFELEIPDITPLMILYFFIFFLSGYFIYATIYALIGSMVSNMQEGGQFALPPVMILMIGLYFCFAVVRDPNSNLAFWVSIAPFFAPIVMPVRILAEIPPFWQIATAIILNFVTIIGLTWVASRVYRVGMLMYGKRATIPEVWKWIKQS